MCVALLAVEVHPRYPLVILANRDESFARPTRPMRVWPGEPAIIAGQDERSGGTWLGLNERSQLALLTNYREPPESSGSRPSRGLLVTAYLRGEHTNFAGYLEEHGKDFAGFNLIFGDFRARLFHYSNRGAGITSLRKGLHGLSNALLDTPWPKVELGKHLLGEALRSDEPGLEALLAILDDSRPAPPEHLPNTGLSPEIESRLSSIRIPPVSGYGSRCATVVMVDSVAQAQVWEKPYDHDGPIRNFRLSGSSLTQGR